LGEISQKGNQLRYDEGTYHDYNGIQGKSQTCVCYDSNDFSDYFIQHDFYVSNARLPAGSKTPA